MSINATHNETDLLNDMKTKNSKKYLYDAFLCHSTRANGELVSFLRQELQTKSRGFLGLRRLHMFQDRYDMVATPTLWSELKLKLSQSRYLVVIMTPHSRGSMGMAQEIDWWKKNRSLDSILLVALSGDLSWNPHTSRFSLKSIVPLILQKQYSEEPYYADLRGYKGVSTKTGNTFTDDTIWVLLGTLVGKSVDELRRTDKARRRTEFVLLAGGSLAIFALLAFGLSQMLGIRTQKAINKEIDNTLNADRAALSSVALLERDVATAAKSLIAAEQIKNTSTTSSLLYQAALRWPFLRGLWHTGFAPDAMHVDSDAKNLFVCGGTSLVRLSTKISGKVSSYPELDVFAIPDGWKPICRFQSKDLVGIFLSIESTPTGDENMGALLPGPTVYSIRNNELSLLHKGSLKDTELNICNTPGLDGLIFNLHGSVWRCLGATPYKISSNNYSVRTWSSLTPSSDGHYVGFIERKLTQQENHLLNPSDSSNVVLYDVESNKIERLQFNAERGDEVLATSATGKQVLIKGYNNRWGTVTAHRDRTPTAYMRDSNNTDIDTMMYFPAKSQAIVKIQSSPYSSTEVDTSQIVADGRFHEFELQRFHGYRERAKLITLINEKNILVGSRSGQIELYDIFDSNSLVSMPPQLGIKRFGMCELFVDKQHKRWILLFSPSGSGYLLEESDLSNRLQISSNSVLLNIYEPTAPEHIREVLSSSLPDSLLTILQSKWQLARSHKVALSQVRASGNGEALGLITRDGKQFILALDSSQITIDAGANQYFSRYGMQKFWLSHTAEYAAVRREEAIDVFHNDWNTSVATMISSFPGATSASFSRDEQRLAVGVESRIESYDVAKLHQHFKTTQESNRSKITNLAPDVILSSPEIQGSTHLFFDQRHPILYSTGQRRIRLHDVISGKRLDANMKIHTQPIESACALPQGGLISLDQSNTLIHWKVSKENIDKAVNNLSTLSLDHAK